MLMGYGSFSAIQHIFSTFSAALVSTTTIKFKIIEFEVSVIQRRENKFYLKIMCAFL